MSLTSYNEKSKSGTATAGASLSNLSTLTGVSDDATNGVIVVQVASTEAAGIEIVGQDSTDGILVANDGVSVPFYCDSMEKIYIKRQGGADITFRYFAF